MKRIYKTIIIFLFIISIFGSYKNSFAENIDKSVDINNTSISCVSYVNYTGDKKEPAIKVVYNSKILKQGNDYIVTYKNNIDIGLGTAKIEGVGNFIGTREIHFKIVPPKILNLEVLSKTVSSIKITWDKVENITGYEIYRSKTYDGNYVKVNTITDNQKNINTSTKLIGGQNYYYKVRGYKIIDGSKYYGSFSNILKTSTKNEISIPNKVDNLKLISNTSSSIKISWSKLSKCDGYEIFRSKEKNSGYIKVNTINNSSTTYSSNGLKSSTTYYYKVRGYSLIENKKNYGEFSDKIETCTKPTKITGMNNISSTTKTIKIKWDKLDYVDGYEVFRSTNYSTSYTKIKNISDSSIIQNISNNLKSGRTYYYKVKAYKLIGDEKYYGQESEVLVCYTKPESMHQVKVVKKDKDIYIYVPCESSNNYIEYYYKRVDNEKINMHQWRVQTTKIVDKYNNEIYSLDTQTEWEGAILEKGQEDFIGGYHGDEKNIDLKILINDESISFDERNFILYCDKIKIINHSYLNRCNKPNQKIFYRTKISTWDIQNYIVENSYKALQNIEISQSKISLMSCKYNQGENELITFAKKNDDGAVLDMSNSFKGFGGTQISKFELWGKYSGLYLSLECEYDREKYPNAKQYISDFRSQNRCKVYFDITGNYLIKEGETLDCKSIFNINYQNI